MAENYNGVMGASGTDAGIADPVFNYEDMPGSYIDDILKSELPGSHLDYLLYGELPGSHLDVVLESPLPGKSTDELLNMPLPGGYSYGIDSIAAGKIAVGKRNNERSHTSYERRQETYSGQAGDRLSELRKARKEEQEIKAYLADLEQKSYSQAAAAQNRINAGSRRGLNDLDSLWTSVRKNVKQNREERLQRLGKMKDFNSSKFVNKQVKSETKKNRKMGALGAFVLMIFLLTFLNRIIIPAVQYIASHIHSEAPAENGEFYLTDDEFNTFYSIYQDISKDRDDFDELFKMSNEDLAKLYEDRGFEVNIDEENEVVSGGYSEAMTWVNFYRNKEYLDFSCQTVSDSIDRSVVEKALTGASTDFVQQYLGKDSSALGLDEELIRKFAEEAGEKEYVSYETDNFTIYFYDYENYTAFYLYEGDDPVYIQVNKDGGWLEMAAVWR